MPAASPVSFPTTTLSTTYRSALDFAPLKKEGPEPIALLGKTPGFSPQPTVGKLIANPPTATTQHILRWPRRVRSKPLSISGRKKKHSASGPWSTLRERATLSPSTSSAPRPAPRSLEDLHQDARPEKRRPPSRQPAKRSQPEIGNAANARIRRVRKRGVQRKIRASSSVPPLPPPLRKKEKFAREPPASKLSQKRSETEISTN